MKAQTRLAAALLCVLSTQAGAELYRWSDSQGRLHFSDKPPPGGGAQALVLSPPNTDHSAGERHKLRQVFNSEKHTERRLAQQAEERARQQRQARHKRCDQARHELELVRGRVYFVDEQGREVTVSEEQRESYAEQLAANIDRFCPRK